MTLEEHEARAASLSAKYDFALRAATEEATRLQAAEKRLAAITEARNRFQALAQSVQQTAHDKIAGVVTRCLQSAGFPYEFLIKFERRRGKTECDLCFGMNGLSLDPREESSGGAVDVAALALRLCCLKLARPALRPLLVLDEPCKNVNGAANQERVCQLLETLSEEMGIQMLIVSDNWLRVGKVIRLGE